MTRHNPRREEARELLALGLLVDGIAARMDVAPRTVRIWTGKRYATFYKKNIRKNRAKHLLPGGLPVRT